MALCHDPAQLLRCQRVLSEEGLQVAVRDLQVLHVYSTSTGTGAGVPSQAVHVGQSLACWSADGTVVTVANSEFLADLVMSPL
jgi:hypothetical protein